MTKPLLNAHIPGQLQRDRAAAERLTILAFVEAHPGATTMIVTEYMQRSIAATSNQLRLLLSEGLVRAEYEMFPIKRAHYYIPAEGETAEVKPLKGEIPRHNIVSVWVHDCPAPDPILAALFGLVEV